MGLRALDLFAGAGGLSCAFEWAGGLVTGGIELDHAAAATFAQNHPDARVWSEDIRGISPHAVAKELGPVDVILGGPMCQGVSQRGPRNPRDERNFAFWAFADYVRELQPTTFVMENVPALASDVHNRALAIEVFSELESLGYKLAAEVLNAAWFGVPQLRYRLVVIGSRQFRPHFPEIVEQGVGGSIPEHSYTTVGEAIMDLPVVRSGGGAEEMDWDRAREAESEYARMMRVGADRIYNHWSSDTEAVNLNRARHVPEGGNWHDIPLELLPPRFGYVRQSDHTTTYRRLHRNYPAHTITTECSNITSGAFTHPTQTRAITVREAARLQGFPDRFRFAGPKGSQYRQVGNAVPPLMAKKIFETFMDGTNDGGYEGRLGADVMRAHPRERLPFVLSPRFKSLFGKSSNAMRDRSDDQPSLLES